MYERTNRVKQSKNKNLINTKLTPIISFNWSIDTGILATLGDANIDSLVLFLKDKKFAEVKKWVTQNLDSDATIIMRKLYDNLSPMMDGPSVAAAVLIIAEYQYKSAFVVDQEINLLACLTQIMLECNFK